MRQSLWECLHDAKLHAIRSDRRERTVVLEFSVFYIREHFHLPEDIRFLFHFDGVSEVNAMGFVFWPEPFTEPQQASQEERGRAVDDWQARGRHESLAWDAFEASVAADTLDVYRAELTLEEGGVSLTIEGPVLETDQWCRACLKAATLSVHRSDGEPCDLETFKKMGEAYWEAFAQRRVPTTEKRPHNN